MGVPLRDRLRVLARRRVLLTSAAVCCLVGAAGLVVVQSGGDDEARSQPPPPVPHTSPTAYDGRPRIVFRNTAVGSSYGLLATVPLARPSAPRALSDVPCDRVDATARGASCLRTVRGTTTRHEWLDLGPDLRTRATTPLGGTPSRTRMSPDGRLVASTVFVEGHSYESTELSTATVVREVGGRKGEHSWGNLEDFALYVDGKRVRPNDRNVWGVTFAGDDDTFYASVSTGGTAYLVRGDLSERTLRSVRAGAECPSLSPDGTRVAYKVDVAEGEAVDWRLAVLDLGSGRQRLLTAEERSVDDQVAWLDDETLLYGLPRDSQAGSTDVWAIRADGTGNVRRMIADAWSPAIVR